MKKKRRTQKPERLKLEGTTLYIRVPGELDHHSADEISRSADRMLEDDGVTPYTAHTTNPVPFYIVGADVKLRDGKLADIAPTMLDLMGLQKPAEMDGETLIVS